MHVAICQMKLLNQSQLRDTYYGKIVVMALFLPTEY